MPIYSSVSEIVKEILSIIPVNIIDPVDNSKFDEVNIRQSEIKQKEYQTCLREGTEYILGQDIRANVNDNISKFDDKKKDRFSSLVLVDVVKDIASVKQAEALTDEYQQLSTLHDQINDRILTLAQNCTHKYSIPTDIQNKLYQVFLQHTNILISAPGQTTLLLNSKDSTLRYQDVLLFLKDLVGQSETFVSKGEFIHPDFYKKNNTKNSSQQSLYRNINMRINPTFIKDMTTQYACARNTNLDKEKVCRRQEAQFGEIIKKIVGTTNIDTLSEYSQTVGADINAVGNQLGDDTQSLKGSYKQSAQRITNAIKLLRESNFGFKDSPTQNQLLETYYNRSIVDIREHTFRQQLKKFIQSMGMGNTDVENSLQYTSPTKETKQFIGVDPNPNNNTQYTSPTQAQTSQMFYNTMTLVFNDVLSDMSTENNAIVYYDSVPQIQSLPEISKKIYEAMVTLGSRNEADTLINGLNLVCKHACGPEGNCG